ncbi:MAG: GIY-YIG nuclease family protein [bacterium]|nr:GIY-YIG nuclease family protein [bacterium]
MWHVYILRCSDGSFYTGCTNNIEERLIRHKRGEVKYTSRRLPFELVTYISFSSRTQAYNFEKYLKTGSGIAFRNKRLV